MELKQKNKIKTVLILNLNQELVAQSKSQPKFNGKSEARPEDSSLQTELVLFSNGEKSEKRGFLVGSQCWLGAEYKSHFLGFNV